MRTHAHTRACEFYARTNACMQRERERAGGKISYKLNFSPPADQSGLTVFLITLVFFFFFPSVTTTLSFSKISSFAFSRYLHRDRLFRLHSEARCYVPRRLCESEPHTITLPSTSKRIFFPFRVCARKANFNVRLPHMFAEIKTSNCFGD